MRHYEVGEWADFVRNLVPVRDRIEMEEHSSSCSECRASLEFIRKLAAAAQAEQLYESASIALAVSARQIFGKQSSAGRAADPVIQEFQVLAGHMTHSGSAARKHRVPKPAGH